MAPLVSVLIAAFRSEDFIVRPVQSVLNQTYPHWEIVIASDDKADYQKILHDKGIRDSRIRFCSTGRIGTGPSPARNTALAQARGDIMAVLDSDDAFAPNKLERLVPKTLAHGAATSDIRIIRSDTLEEFPSISQRIPPGPLTPDDFIRAHITTCSTLVWDRKQMTECWDEKVGFAEDLVHGLCMYNRLEGIYYDPEILHDYYRRPNSITTSIDTESEDAMAKMIGLFQGLIDRAREGSLPIKNTAALDALIRFQTRCIANEKQFFKEEITDPLMEFYHIMKENRDAYFDW
jgi:succinoglycan biosynthesis protein ExoO